MNRAARGLFGAMLGALVVLALHPKSRPFLLGSVLSGSASYADEASAKVHGPSARLPSPQDLSAASLWLQVGAENDLSGRRLSVDQALLLAEIAQKGAQAEPDNAYWHEMESFFASIALRDKSQSLRSWSRAAECVVWNDHQGERLDKLVAGFDRAAGAAFAWHRALAYSRRSGAAPTRMLVLSRELMSAADGALDVRVASIKNGKLIRDGSRSLEGGLAGARMVDLAVMQASQLSPQLSPKTESEARAKILSEVAPDRDTQRAVNQALVGNEAWKTQLPLEDFQTLARAEAALAIVTVTLPSVLLVIGLGGFLLWGTTALVQKYSRVNRLLTPKGAPLLAVALGLAVFLATRLPFASLMTTVVFGAFCLTPDRLKDGAVTGLGIVYEVVLAVLSLSAGTGLGIHLVERSVPARELAGFASVPVSAPVGESVPLGFSLLSVLFVVLTAPVWGYLYRYPASNVLPKSVERFCGLVCVLALFGSIVSTPLCMLADQRIGTTLGELLGNEPQHYFAQPDR